MLMWRRLFSPPASVGKQIADMVRQLINGDDIAQLQVLWQPEFFPGQTA